MSMPMDALALDVAAMTALCRALGDETRLRIVALLSHGELCVCHLQEALGLSQPNVSRQLAILRAAGLVEHRRDGTWVYYRLRPQENEDRHRLLRVVRSFAQREGLREDIRKLRATCGPGAAQ